MRARFTGRGRTGRTIGLTSVALALTLSVAGCSGAGNVGKGDPNTINVLMVNNPQMVDLQKLTARALHQGDRHQGELTPCCRRTTARQDQPGLLQPGRPVRRRHPQQLRDADLRHATAGCRRSTRRPRRTPTFDQSDILNPMRQSLTAADGKVYAEPFYGESSFLMYRKDVFAGEGPDHARPPDLAAGRRRWPRRSTAPQSGHEGHLPARPARLGRGDRAADHGREHLRRHLVRPRTGRPRSTSPEFTEADQVLRRPGPQARRGRAPRRPASPSASTT